MLLVQVPHGLWQVPPVVPQVHQLTPSPAWKVHLPPAPQSASARQVSGAVQVALPAPALLPQPPWNVCGMLPPATLVSPPE